MTFYSHTTQQNYHRIDVVTRITLTTSVQYSGIFNQIKLFIFGMIPITDNRIVSSSLESVELST